PPIARSGGSRGAGSVMNTGPFSMDSPPNPGTTRSRPICPTRSGNTSRKREKRSRHKRRKAPRDECSIEFQHRLRAGFPREFGRLGAVDGGGCASVAHAYEVRPHQSSIAASILISDALPFTVTTKRTTDRKRTS